MEPEHFVKNLETYLKWWEELTNDMNDMGKNIKRYAQLTAKIVDRSELPDWVIILAEGNPEHMTDVIAVARDDMKEHRKCKQR